ncbi:hypothetical protein F2Q69_00044336 [Brassica cretica]|uniref:Uncharacterized protein n=1 Tax=Brassica cretica TaxID=69181 RepID=A0A8S9NIU5_BRACR|nr:hypothetical protein F2Q69_00044336 [Brassica cretica]
MSSITSQAPNRSSLPRNRGEKPANAHGNTACAQTTKHPHDVWETVVTNHDGLQDIIPKIQVEDYTNYEERNGCIQRREQ